MTSFFVTTAQRVSRKVRGFVRCIRDGHLFMFVTNIHGDAINLHDGNRSLWHCPSCGAWQSRRKLHAPNVGSTSGGTDNMKTIE